MDNASTAYDEAYQHAREAFALCLANEIDHAQELLLRTRNALKRLSGDLPIFDAHPPSDEQHTMHFITYSFTEARAWGWLELTSGVYRLMLDLPGTSMMHCTRAWRIWRPWSSGLVDATPSEQHEARYERVRAGLWLGESWARFMSERAQHTAQAVLRASLSELQRLQANDLLRETIAQQTLLPPTSPGVPAYHPDGSRVPYVATLLASS